MKTIRAILLAFVVIPSLGIGILIGYDILLDRQNFVVTEEAIPAYTDWETYPSKEMKPIFVLSAKTDAKVKRIRYGKDCMVVRVENEKGEMGWIFYNGRSFRIKPGRLQVR